MALSTPFRAHCFAFLFIAALAAPAQTASNQLFAARAQRAFLQAQKNFTDNFNETNALRLGRTAYDWAEFSTNESQRAEIARAGIAACRQWLARQPKSAPGHYYLAMNDGELAEAEAPSMAAYKLVREIEHEFKTAADLDESFDYAGPPRCLGLLYRDAPGWPLSIGSKHKAREWLERAAALAPDFPENQLNLAESQVRWHQAAEAEQTLKKLAAIWSPARSRFTGEAWDPSWADWITRRAAVEAEFQKTFKRAPDLP